MNGSGHRRLPHEEDSGFEVWAPSRDECYAEAVRVLVSSFAEPAMRGDAKEVRVALQPASEADLLADLLDEVLALADVEGLVPVDVAVEDGEDGGLTAEMIVVSARGGDLVSAVPRSVSAHGLTFHRESDHWSCRFLLDDEDSG